MKKTPIDAWLFEKGMTQKDLAKRLKYSYAHVSQMLNGKVTLSAKMYMALRKVIPKKIVDEHFGL